MSIYRAVYIYGYRSIHARMFILSVGIYNINVCAGGKNLMMKHFKLCIVYKESQTRCWRFRHEFSNENENKPHIYGDGIPAWSIIIIIIIMMMIRTMPACLNVNQTNDGWKCARRFVRFVNYWWFSIKYYLKSPRKLRLALGLALGAIWDQIPRIF